MEEKKYALCTILNDVLEEYGETMVYSFIMNNIWFRGDLIIICDEGEYNARISEPRLYKIRAIYPKIKIHKVNTLEYKKIMERFMGKYGEKSPHYFYKFECFGFDDYDKVVYIDPSVLVLKNIENVFKDESDSILMPLEIYTNKQKDYAKNNVYEGEYLNSNFMVIPKKYCNCKEELIKYARRFRINDKGGIRSGQYYENDVINSWIKKKDCIILSSMINWCTNFNKIYEMKYYVQEASMITFDCGLPLLGCGGMINNDFQGSIYNQYFNQFKEYFQRYRPNMALCTVINSETVENGLILISSFIENNSWFDDDIVLIVNGDISDEDRMRFYKVYDKILFGDNDTEHFNGIKERFSRMYSFKDEELGLLHCFSFPQYQRIVYMDVKTVVTMNIDTLFLTDEDMVICQDITSIPIDNEKMVFGGFFRSNEYCKFNVMSISSRYTNALASIIELSRDFNKNGKYSGTHGLQDLLNLFIDGKVVMVLPNIFNCPSNINVTNSGAFSSLMLNKAKVINYSDNLPIKEDVNDNIEYCLKYFKNKIK